MPPEAKAHWHEHRHMVRVVIKGRYAFYKCPECEDFKGKTLLRDATKVRFIHKRWNPDGGTLA